MRERLLDNTGSRTFSTSDSGTAKTRLRAADSGYVLIGVLFLVAVFSIFLAVAIPQMARSIQRDREMETIARGKQYTRAIRLYYRKFGKYPSSLDELASTNQIRFLRKRYIDPMTGKDDWKLIHLGEAKVPSLGFFGVPIGIPGFGSPAPQALNSAGPLNSANPASPQDSSGIQTSLPQTDSTGSPTPTSGISSSAPQSSASSLDGANGSAGGVVFGQIVGVGVPLDKSSLLNFKKQNNYSRWEFVYDPQLDKLGATGFPTGSPNGTVQPGSSNPVLSPATPSTPASGEPVITPSPPPDSTN